MPKSKGTKLNQVIVAYDRFQKEEKVTVQIIDFKLHRPIAEFQVPRAIFSKPWEELQTVIRFRARRDFDLILPKSWSFWNKLVKQ
jgi:hypothetical protein